jgi:DNA processing protein
MSKDPLIYQLAMTMVPGIGAITARKLIAYVGSPEAVFSEKPAILRQIPGVGEHLAGQVSARDLVAEAEAEILRMKKYRVSSVYYQDEAYPWRLKNCEDGPLLLFYRGNPDFRRTKTLSIVGTRNASPYGREMTDAIISGLAAKFPDLVIISGLAYGIDINAHRAALGNGLDTYAVMAHGLHTVYPSAHASTASRMLSQGALLSDFPTTMKPERNNFLRRNRIIAGLSEATLVIESGNKGGALITAELAASYHREVFAVPGRTTDTFSVGCNQIIQQNIAALVTSDADIELLLGWESAGTPPAPEPLTINNLSSLEEKILQEIIAAPGLGQEILSTRTGIVVHKLMGILLQMELNQWITVLPGNHYKALVRPAD